MFTSQSVSLEESTLAQSYVVLARKWRPAQFKDIVGQAHIVRTLTNAIRSERIHQAYLFTGSRGIGKTSIARIFAKVLRCEFMKDQDGLLQSCDQCPSCKEITLGNSVDVIEIDGASNNGVEAIREIRENAKYMPAMGTRKIYIIDEVHMLTTAAFNALLKTLEEPPAHVIFIFATTEPHKIPATVLSRCQRFDYRKVTLHQIQTRLEEILKNEEIEAESGALSIIARAADGSMRDSLSLLDQVIAFSGKKITTQSTRESIGLIEGQSLIEILSHIFNKKPLEAVHHVEQIHQQGHDLRILTRGLIEFLYACILLKIGSTQLGTLELSEQEASELHAMIPLRTLEEMEIIFQVLHQGLEWIARSPQPKLVLNVLIIKCATAEALISLEQSTPPSAPPAIEKHPQKQGSPSSRTTPPHTASSSTASPITRGATLNSPLAEKQPSSPIQNPEPSQPPAEPLKTHPQGHEKNWENLITFIRKTRPLLASILEHAISTEIKASPSSQTPESYLTLSFSPGEAYFKEQLQAKVYQEQLFTLCREFFGHPVRLQIDFKNTGESFAARREREEKQRIQSTQEKALNHPILLEARSLFGGNLGPIEIKENTQHAEKPR